MYSEVLQKFASQLVRRSSKNQKPKALENPYHPEDELFNSFNADVDKKSQYESSDSKLVITTDTLEKQNYQFLIGNDVASDDILTDAEDMKPINKIVEKHKAHKMASNLTTNSTSEYFKKKIDSAVHNNSKTSTEDVKISGHMKILDDDRAYFKPVQRRFVLKNSNNTPTNTLII